MTALPPEQPCLACFEPELPRQWSYVADADPRVAQDILTKTSRLVGRERYESKPAALQLAGPLLAENVIVPGAGYPAPA